jgi:hypothetical protein
VVVAEVDVEESFVDVEAVIALIALDDELFAMDFGATLELEVAVAFKVDLKVAFTRKIAVVSVGGVVDSSSPTAVSVA